MEREGRAVALRAKHAAALRAAVEENKDNSTKNSRRFYTGGISFCPEAANNNIILLDSSLSSFIRGGAAAKDYGSFFCKIKKEERGALPQ